MSNLPAIIKMSENDNVVNRVKSLLKDEAGSFVASVINISRGSQTLQLCDPIKLWGEAIKAAAVKLPIEPSLGYACIVPYKNHKTGEYNPSFIIEVRGYIQLALRTGKYKDITVSTVFEDELVSYNPILDKVVLVEKTPENPMRYDGKSKPCGYYASFELLTGFSKETYWSMDRIMNHVYQYVPSWSKKDKKFSDGSYWQKNFDAMASKTALKYLLSHWGMMSVEMAKAVQDDESNVVDAETTANAPTTESIQDAPQAVRKGRVKKEEIVDAVVETKPEAPVEAPTEEKDPFDD